MKRRNLGVIAGLLSGLMLIGTGMGQKPVPTAAKGKTTVEPAPKTNGAKPLEIYQQRVIRLMQQLESKMQQLASQLEKTQPEKAKRLRAAFLQSKKLLIEKRMQSIAKLLDSDDLDSANDEQKKLAEHYKAKLDESQAFPAPIVTEITKFSRFYAAETHHQNYNDNNGQDRYCQAVIRPKLEKFRQVFAKKLRTP